MHLKCYTTLRVVRKITINNVKNTSVFSLNKTELVILIKIQVLNVENNIKIETRNTSTKL